MPTPPSLPPVARTMEAAVARIVGRDLTEDDRQLLIAVRDQYGYDDDDPLVVVLAMTGALKIMMDELPERLKKASEHLTEVHQITLKNQSAIIAKDLVGIVAEHIHAAGRTRKGRLIDAALGAAGVLAFALLVGVVMYIRSH
jgi:hypothetical protein